MSTLTIQDELAKIKEVHRVKLTDLTMEQRTILMYRLQQLLLANREPKSA